MSDIGQKLLNHNDLTLRDINLLGYSYLEKAGYEKKQLIVCEVAELLENIASNKNDDLEKNPIFFICGANNRSTFCITKYSGDIICLYKKISNEDELKIIKDILEKQFGKNI